MITKLPDEQLFVEIKSLIDTARNKALQSVNTELIHLYWNIGSFISKKSAESNWGDKTVEQLAEYLNSFGPDYKSFTRRTLFRMRPILWGLLR